MKYLYVLVLLTTICFTTFSQNTTIQYLSGTDKDPTVLWDFYCSAGRNSGKWTKIPVPSNWELQGFGSYNYGHDKEKATEQGTYKHSFRSQKTWKGKKVFIVFDGSMTDTEVRINGAQAGPVHQGGFYRFKYEITNLLKPAAQNILEVTVSKHSSNNSVNKAERSGDFWAFGGIFRPVYLEIVPETYIDRVAVDAKADGSFQLQVFAQHAHSDDIIEAEVQTLRGAVVGKPFSIKAGATQEIPVLKNNFVKPLLWSAEFPNLYKVVISIKRGAKQIHQVTEKFGFRTVELRANDGLYVNGAKIILKGCNRHSFWPETGRTLSRAVHVMDIELMKSMNMNAVRMSHYPPDIDFLNLCDSMGLYVLDELAGWQASYDSIIGRTLVKELVIRDVNHPSIILWDNGNEGGWNRSLDGDFSLYDPQQRKVIHPWEKFNGTQTKHYPDYNYILKTNDQEQEVFFTTEFMHALYDGGGGAALDDFWKLMLKNPRGAGGFIWALLDESVIRTDKNNVYDSDGNHAPDGIVGPHREKEGSFYTIKEIWSPVYIELPGIEDGFDGKVPIENRYAFTNLNQCSFKWKLLSFPTATKNDSDVVTDATGIPELLDLSPGEKGMLNLRLPASWSKSDALYLSAYGPDQKELFTWSWAISSPATFVKRLSAPVVSGAVTAEESDSMLVVTCDRVRYWFNTHSGQLEKVANDSTILSLSGGPVLAGVATALKNFSHKKIADAYTVEAGYGGEASLEVRWTFSPGKPVQLDYQYTQQGDVDFMGITFNYPEEKMVGMKWLGRGPYRVWQNRLKGQRLGVWHKAYNNSITGETFNYPEFKGYHAQLYWVTIENTESAFTVYTADKDVYLQMFHPARESDALKNNNVEPAFPQGNLGFLKSIPAIGTKFQAAKVMGPQSQKTHANGEPVKGTLWFRF